MRAADTITLGVLTLVADHAGPFLKVGVRSPSGAEHGELNMTVGEWTSLKALVDVLAAADKRHAEDRAQVDVLRQEVRELEQQRDHMRERLFVATNLDTRDAEIIRLRCQLEAASGQLEAARVATRALMAQVEHLAAFADDSDPRVMATTAPLGAAQADLWLALGLDLDAEHARMQADIDSRCAVCGWPLAESVEDGCVRGNCSMRPRPDRLYAPERAAREAAGV